MAEAFRDAGYLTAAFIRNDFVGPTTNTQQGFDFFFPGETVLEAGAPPERRGLNQVVARMLGRNSDAALLGGNANIFASGSSRDLYVRAEPWLRKYADVPFLLYLHAVDPHEPFEPEESDWSAFLSKEEKKRYDEGEQAVQRVLGQMAQAVMNAMAPGAAAGPAGAPGGPAAQPRSQREAIAQALLDPKDPTSKLDPDAHMEKLRRIYDAEVRYLDRHLKMVLDVLDETALAARTIVSFNSDHGEEFLEHDNIGHGQSVYAELNHVPWILRAPGLVPGGRVVPDSVMNLDVAPTLLSLCGGDVPETMQGRDLSEILKEGGDVPPAPIFTERWGGGIFSFGGPGGGAFANGDLEFLGQWAVIEGRWKTVVTREAEPPRGPDGNPLLGPDGKPLPTRLKVVLEIYDLLADMKDSRSLIETERPRAEAAAKRLEVWLREMKKLNEQRFAGEDTTSENAAAALRALGYAQ
jgi:arylsulfatase A-like enzyme